MNGIKMNQDFLSIQNVCNVSINESLQIGIGLNQVVIVDVKCCLSWCIFCQRKKEMIMKIIFCYI